MPTLDFKGKQFVYSHHLSVPFRELKVVADKSLPQQGKAASLDDNLIIHGDNLEALKALLPTHAGKVDCIFIDPPYNTGNEGWCYNDNVRSPLMQEWLKKSANPVDKEDLERHDKWLCMMWPRLILLRELLNENGSIFITIGDDEQHALRLLLDEIFGRENFITSICWKRKVSPSNDAEYFSSDHDWLLVYAKNQEEWSINRLPMNEGQLKNYTSSDDDERGAWSSGTYTCNKSKSERPNLYYGITNPNTGEVVYPSETAVWKFSQEKTIALQNDDMLYWGKDGKSTKPRLKKFLSDAKGVVPRSVWDYSDSGSTQSASIELSKIFNGVSPFPTPKPSVLISKILKIATDENSIILDSFAGSGTTAHAVLEANKSDEGNRKFILIECEDYADEVTAERVRRVINGYPFKGNQKQELLSEKITWSVFEKKHAELLENIAKVEAKHSNDFDKIKKELKDGVLTVTGERKVDELSLIHI